MTWVASVVAAARCVPSSTPERWFPRMKRRTSSARVLSLKLSEDAALKLEDGFRVDAMEIAPKEAKDAAPE